MFTYPFEILKLRLSTEVTELREIEWYMNQDDEKDKDGNLTVSPGLYIQFNPNEPKDMALRIQQAETTFDLILLTSCVLTKGSQRLKKDNPLDHMRIFDKVYSAMSGFSSKISFLPEFTALSGTPDDQRVMNSITRIGITPPHTPRKAFMRSVQRFRTIIYDHGGFEPYTSTSQPLELTTSIE